MATVDHGLAGMEIIETRYLDILNSLLYNEYLRILSEIGSPTGRISVSRDFSRDFTVLLRSVWRDSVTLGIAHFEEMVERKAITDLQVLEQYVSKYGLRQRLRMENVTSDYILETILLEQRRGMSVDDIIAVLRADMPRLSATRARVIVQTETHAAYQFGSFTAARSSGLQLIKQWNTTKDERTRQFMNSNYNHILMDGVQRPLEQGYLTPTLNGTELLMFPGDPAGSAGNIINCRCVQTYIRT